MRKKSIGKSVLGKEISALALGDPQSYSLYAAAFHGSEHITSNVIMMWLEDLCEAVQNDTPIGGINIRKALFGRGVMIIPRINPDGCDISVLGAAACGEKAWEIERMTAGDFKRYNANFRGVDINHNFDAGWKELRDKERKMGILGPSPGRFGGFSPESEPETAALCDLCRNNNIRQVFAIHSQGRVIYWSYGKRRPGRSRRIAELMSTESGYALDYPISIADGGGFKDWFIEKFDRPGFTIEIGKGQNPLPVDSAKDIYDEVKKMLTLSTIL
ncbi:MAG: M14 family metallocarboxypeptidase [Clostridia bacterium]|nr:M14 family metallocarboxypeptidase [Clostridia bacterium]